MLEAAAVAIRHAQDGEITARGTLGPLLTSEPHRPVDAGTPPRPSVSDSHSSTSPTGLPHVPERSAWEDVQASIKEVFEAAKTDPGTAYQVLKINTHGCRDHSAFDRARRQLIDYGIPEQFLPEEDVFDRTTFF